MRRSISGSKGGGGAFTQRPDSLRSDDTFEGLLGLCSGPIVGPTNGLKSIKIDGTPLEDVDGSSNFPGFVTVIANGDPLLWPQKPGLKLGNGAAPVPVNLQLSNTTGTGVYVTKTVPNTGADFIDLRFVVSQLYRQTKKGIFEHTANLQIEMKPSGTATWVNPLINSPTVEPVYSAFGIQFEEGIRLIPMRDEYSDVPNGSGEYERTYTATSGLLQIHGKTTSPYVHELRVAIPNTGDYAGVGWDIRVRLVELETVDDDPNFEKRTIQWESAAAVYKTDLGADEEWAGLAWLTLYGVASDKLTGVPEIWGEYDTKIVSVPNSSVYNPVTRQYTATTWNGSWAKSFTTDPAWIINDAISDGVCGIAALAPGSYLNKWDALDVSKYCSALVPDGDGGFHPRYSLNMYVDQPQKADEFIRYMAGAVGGVAWDEGNGVWRMKLDKPESAIATFTDHNIEGEFNYSHTDVDVRYNDITFSFLNAEFDYREDRVRVWDQADIDINGRKPTTVVGIGCTNRQEAYRRAFLRLRASLNEYRMVSFTTNRQGRYLERLSNILIADGSLGYQLPSGSTFLTDSDETDNRTMGRMISMNAGRTQITLRDTLRLEPSAAYKIWLTVPNPNYNPEPSTQPASADWDKPTIAISAAVSAGSARGDVKVITLTTALPANTPENAPIALEATGLPTNPRTYRILDISQGDDGERVTITALEVDTGKYAAADAVDPAAIEAQVPNATCPPPIEPADGMFSVDLFQSDFVIKKVLNVDWERPASKYVSGYDVAYRFNNGPLIPYGTTTDTRVEIQNPEPGFWYFEIRTIDRRGIKSVPLSGTEEVLDDVAYAPIGYLTNESHTVATNPDGTGGDYSEAGGTFILQNANGVIVEGDSFEVVSGTVTGGLSISINPDTGVYLVTDLTSNQGSAVLRGHWLGYQVDKQYSISKSLAGYTMSLITDRQTIGYGSDGLPEPFDATQDIHLTINKVGTTLDARFTLTTIDGVLIDANPYIDGTGTVTDNGDGSLTQTGLTATITIDSYHAASAATNGIIVICQVGEVTDKISILKVAKGEDGAPGSSVIGITISASHSLFHYNTSGVITPQTTSFAAYRQNSVSPINWQIFKGDGVTPMIGAGAAILDTSDGNAATEFAGIFTISGGDGEVLTIDSDAFDALITANDTNGMVVRAFIFDGITYDAMASVLTVQDGIDGPPGTGVSAHLTNDSFVVPADYLGNVITYAGAFGNFIITNNNIDVSADFTITVQDNPQSLTGAFSGGDILFDNAYAVSGGFNNDEDAASVYFRAIGNTGTDFEGLIIDKVFSLTKAKQGDPADFDTVPPPNVGTITLTTTAGAGTPGAELSSINASWTASTDPAVSYYTVAIAPNLGSDAAPDGDWSNGVVYQATDPKYHWDVAPGTKWKVRVKAVDHVGNPSTGWSATAAITAATDAVAPGVPVGVGLEPSIGTIFIKWTNPSAVDLSAVEIWENIVNDSSTATKITTVKATASTAGRFTRGGLTAGSTRYYWLKAVDTSGNASAFTSVAFTTTAIAGTADIAVNSIVTNHMAVGSILGDRIVVDSLDANRLTATSILADTLVIGAGGPQLGSVADNALVARSSNLLPMDKWVVGPVSTTVTQPDFDAEFPAADSIALLPGPDSVPEPVWVCTNNAAPGGGFLSRVGTGQGFDATKTYVYSVYIKRTTDAASGFQLGFDLSDTYDVTTGAYNPNPIGAGISTDLLQKGKWYIAAAVVYGSGFSGTITRLSGIFDPATGAAVSLTTADYTQKNAPGGTHQALRVIHYGGSGVMAGLQIARPCIEELGSGSTILDTIKGPGGGANLFPDASFETGLPTKVNYADGGGVSLTLQTTGGAVASPNFVRADAAGGHYFYYPGSAFVAQSDKVMISVWLKDSGVAGVGTGGPPPDNPFPVSFGLTTNLSTHNIFAGSGKLTFQPATGSGWTRFSGAITGLTPGTTYYVEQQVEGSAGRRMVDMDAIMVEHGGVANDFALRTYDQVAPRVNAQQTLITAGKISLTGATPLSSWLYGPDQSLFNGGFIAANSVAANAVVVGLRGLQFAGLEFEANRSTVGSATVTPNTIAWTAGTINYINDAGVSTTASISAGSAAWSSGTIFLYWVKGATTISSTTVAATANAANNVNLGTYRGGTDATITMGRTIIDGSDITTGTINASKLLAGSITAAQISSVAGITGGQIAGTTITGGNIVTGTLLGSHLAANTITSNELSTANLITLTAQIGNGIITNLKIGTGAVDTLKIAGNTVTVPTIITFGDISVPNSGAVVTIGTTSNVVVGDAIGGMALITVSGHFDGTVDIDAAVQIYLDISTNGGASFSLAVKTWRCGARSTGSSTYSFAPWSAQYQVAGVTQVVARLRAVSIAMGPGAGLRASAVREPTVVILGGKR